MHPTCTLSRKPCGIRRRVKAKQPCILALTRAIAMLEALAETASTSAAIEILVRPGGNKAAI